MIAIVVGRKLHPAKRGPPHRGNLLAEAYYHGTIWIISRTNAMMVELGHRPRGSILTT